MCVFACIISRIAQPTLRLYLGICWSRLDARPFKSARLLLLFLKSVKVILQYKVTIYYHSDKGHIGFWSFTRLLGVCARSFLIPIHTLTHTLTLDVSSYILIANKWKSTRYRRRV